MHAPKSRSLLRPVSLAAVCLLVFGLALGWVYFGRVDSEPPAFSQQKPAVGQSAPDFILRDPDGGEFRLADELKGKPVIIEFGSVTCLQCVLGQFEAKEALAKEYSDRAVFVFVYCREAHPDREFGSMALTSGPAPGQTHTWEERAERARSFRKNMNVARRILIDEAKDSVQDRFGGQDNQVVIIGRDGRIAFKQLYTDHRELRRFLDGCHP